MDGSIEQTKETNCRRCGSKLSGRLAFTLGGEVRCARCALTYRPLLRRSLYTAVVVGTILVLINQGNVLVGGRLPPELLWKLPLTYVVPFCVTTWGALINSRVRH